MNAQRGRRKRRAGDLEIRLLQRTTGLDRVAAEQHAARIRDDLATKGRGRSARLLAIALLIALLIVALTATVAAAQEALPGDTLYGLKRGSESVRLFLELDEAGRDALHVTFAQRRRSEAERRPEHATALLSHAFDHLSHVETLEDETAVVTVSLVNQVDLLLEGQLPPAASDRARFALARARREIANGIDLPPVVASNRSTRGGEGAGGDDAPADSSPAAGASPSQGGPSADGPGGDPPASAGKPPSPGQSSSGAKSSASDTASGNSNASSNDASSGSSADAPSPPGKASPPGPPDANMPEDAGPPDDKGKPGEGE